MGGSQKSKRVSWATEVNLCQVRLFLSEECPSQVGMGTQDHLLQAKALSLRAGGMAYEDNLPPGFELSQPANPWAAKLSHISLVKWKCPPRIEVDSSWRVVAGEESRETETQDQREMRVLEAIYPRPSAIPLNPSALVGAEDSTNNDQCTPVVPITSIEDEDASVDTFYASMGPNITPMISQQQYSPHGELLSQVNTTLTPSVGSATGMEPDIIAAAQAALSSVMPNSDQRNLIDRELLMKILNDPKMIEQLIANHAASASGQNVASSSMASSSTFHGMPAIGTKNVASYSLPGIPSTSAQYVPNLASTPKSSYDSDIMAVHRREPLPGRFTRPEMVVPSPIFAASGPYHSPSRTGSIPHVRPSVPDVISVPSPSIAAPVAKDINYYKSLIQQHGGERRETMPPQFAHQSNQAPAMGQEPLNTAMMRPRHTKPRIMKPCIYFNSSRGCRNGPNCTFQHDVSPQQKVNSIPDVQGTKRMKMDREITGA
ncbi:zinc finger CCCH domain-containing protein 6-like isoform X1 [Salvia splendens]|uniref:zinc finger CCCH domain-containing protein 6-like isoform X1 n=1 Tax=Salvia splendens TaxID=180675 RepID=UPI001C276396|nr:zinc finger CCCH domain-containing protein 6-like isoform X1 [Salvia splendens]